MKLAPLQAAIDQCLREDPARSNRDIARSLKCHWSTVGAHRTRMEDDGQISREHRRVPNGTPHPGFNVQPAPLGNMRAMTAGGHRSRRKIAPIAERYVVKVRAAHPGEPDTTTETHAHRLARLEILRRS